MPEPVGWDDPRKEPETSRGGTFSSRLLRGPDEGPPSPRFLKLALLGAAIIVAIALILYFKARKAPPALQNELHSTPASLYACDISKSAASSAERRHPGAARWKQELTASKPRS